MLILRVDASRFPVVIKRRIVFKFELFDILFVEVKLQLLAEGIISVRIPTLRTFIHSSLRGLDCAFIDIKELVDIELLDYLIIKLLILDI